MEAITWALVLSSIVLVASVKLVNLFWWRPKKLEKILREQGLNGTPYRPFIGDLRVMMRVIKAEQQRSVQLSTDDTSPHVFAYYLDILNKYGRNSFFWFGLRPRLNIVDPELVKEVLKKNDVFQKPFPEISKKVASGLVLLEGQKWAKHRKIINPAFHMLKLKNMVPAMCLSCSNMISKLNSMVSSSDEGWCEIDMWLWLRDLTGDVISRTAFGSSYEEGASIFQLQRERLKLAPQLLKFSFIPGWRYLPTKLNKKVKAMNNEIDSRLRVIINKRQKSIDSGESFPGDHDDLLGILIESNSRFAQETGNKNRGMSMEDVIDECKLFYLASSNTTAGLIVWTMVLLCRHPEWQTKARDEVMRIFGDSEPSFETLNQLKTVTMILQEVSRLYPALPILNRYATETVEIGNLTIPAGVQVSLHLGLLQRDPDIWGDDANEFNPLRFSEGVSNAAKIPSSFVSFGSGPRVCIGQNFAMMEAKMGVAMILQSFSFELSPSYLHAPFAPVSNLQPQYGVPIILRNLQESLS